MWILKANTDLADEGKRLPPHPLGTVAEPHGQLIDELQAQVISPAGIQLLQNFHHLTTGKSTQPTQTTSRSFNE